MIFIGLIIILLISYFVIKIINNKYKTFVLDHSVLLKKILLINKKYQFRPIKSHDLKYSYDNEDYYETISTQDFLIYDLVSNQK